MKAELRTYPTRKEWLAAREGSTGGSGIVNILGVPIDGREPNGLWWEWLRSNPAARSAVDEERYRELEAKTMLDPIELAVRQALEPAIERWGAERAGILIYDPGLAIVTNPAIPRAHASPDGLVVEATAEVSEGAEVYARWATDPKTFTEYKTISPFARHHWSDDDPSEYAIYQAHWYGLIFGVPDCWIFGMVGYGGSESDRLAYHLEFSEELQALLREQHERFWKYVDEDREPPVEGFAKTTQAIRLLYKAHPKGGRGATITLPPEGGWLEFPDQDEAFATPWWALERELRDIDERQDELKRRREQLRQAIELEMGHHDAEVAVIPPYDAMGSDVLDGKTTTYYRREITRKPRACKACGEEIQAGSTYTTLTSSRKE